LSTADVNPLAEGLDRERVAPPCVLVVFGASGDLTSRKLMPAIEQLALKRLLPAAFAVVGVARTEMDDDDFHQRMREAVKDENGGEEAAHVWDQFTGGFRYVAGGSISVMASTCMTWFWTMSRSAPACS
jgi:glucose-6-phosphate 1-dehydrogenase